MRADAAELPVDALLLYTPARMVQAKGIQTFALERAGILTLGKHSAVEDKVGPLLKDYQKLWRLMLFVHPEYVEEDLKLSKAVDVLLGDFAAIQSMENAFDTSYGELVPKIIDACWFHYIPRSNRDAASSLVEVIGPDGRPDWEIFMGAALEGVEGTIDAHEHAARAYLWQRLDAEGAQPSDDFDNIRKKYKKHGSLWEDINRRLQNQKNVEILSTTARIRRGIEDIVDGVLSSEEPSEDVGRT